MAIKLKPETEVTKTMTTLETMSQVLKPAYQLVSAETGLVFATSLLATEVMSDDDPPGWADRDEIWTIDTLLGCYNSQKCQIMIFNKGIKYIAHELSVKPLIIEYIVRIHEWGHAAFHLGVDEAKSSELAKAYLSNYENVGRITRNELFGVYLSVESYVHEQIAQSITWLCLEKLRAGAASVDAEKACALSIDTFNALTRRQPKQYRLDQFKQLECSQLKRRLRDFIGLVRDGGVRGDERTWDTIMPW